jgi:predicted transcriptional regulator
MKHGEMRERVLEAFSRNPGASIRELAAELKIGVYTCHYHLTLLENEGLIERNHKVGNYKGKPHTGASKREKSALQERIDRVVQAAAEKEAAR